MTKPKNPLSILSRAAQAHLVTDPFPHLVITEALEPAIFEQLANQFPSEEVILNGQPPRDTVFIYSACEVLQDERISPLWKEFCSYHVSKDFFNDLIALAGPQLRALHPDLEKKIGRPLEEFEVGMRPGGANRPLAEGADVSMECQFFMSYTKQQPRSVRGPHVDRPSELFAALLYFRREDDDSSGGNLEICEATSNIYPNAHTIHISAPTAEVDWSHVRTIQTVKYAANTLVLFLNSSRAIHAISPRSQTSVPRRHINFCCDVRFDLFEIKLPASTIAKNWLRNSVRRPRSLVKKWVLSVPILWRLEKYL